MIVWLLALAQGGIPNAESDPRAVRIEAGDERLSAVLARLGEETGVGFRVVGAWDPRVARGVREGPFWSVIDALARDVGARPQVEYAWDSEGNEYPAEVRLERAEDRSPVAYAGPFRVAIREARFRRAVGGGATTAVGWLQIFAWPEPGRSPVKFEWVVDRLEVAGRAVEPTVDASAWGEVGVTFPVELLGEVVMAARLRAEYLGDVAVARVRYADLRERTELRVGERTVRIRPEEWATEVEDEDQWYAVLELEDAGEDSRLGIAAGSPNVENSGGYVFGWTEAEDGPGVLHVDATWAGVPEEEREVAIWCAEGVRTREWEVRFDGFALPGEE